jgi:ferredoxin-nitrite reductase
MADGASQDGASADATLPDTSGMSVVQKEYLSGFGAGLAAARALPAAGSGTPAEASNWFNTPIDEITREERLKIERDPFAIWDQMVAAAQSGTPPADGDVFRYKYHGLFWVAPAQDFFMVRIKIPGNVLSSHQARAVARISDDLANGFVDVTTRGNLQVRNLPPSAPVEVLKRLFECGLSSRGAGADNVRNVTASPLAGLDPSELIDTRGLARDMQFYINNHLEVFGLPRKFNISFDGGGAISNVSDTNDIAFIATRTKDQPDTGAVLFRVQLAGITGHQRFAVESGIVVEPKHAVQLAGAMLHVFAEHGDRTNRNTARLCYLLDRIGMDEFLKLTEAHFGMPLSHVAASSLTARPAVQRRAHLGAHVQGTSGRHYVGVLVTAGRLSTAQLRKLAEAADRYGEGELRLTVWQNVLIPSVRDEYLHDLMDFLADEGLSCDASSVAGTMVACTGNTGCRFAESDTKGHAAQIASSIAGRFSFSDAINIHLTGCPHSCAQHYIGDIGLLGAQMPQADGQPRIEGYHMYLGGGSDDQQGLAREIARNVPALELPHMVTHLLQQYQGQMLPGETFFAFAARHSVDELRVMALLPAVAAAN